MLKNIKPGDWVTQRHWRGNAFLVLSVKDDGIYLSWAGGEFRYNLTTPFLRCDKLISLFYNVRREK